MSICAELCSAAEQLYYEGAPLAHVVAYEERLRETRREKLSASVRRWRRPLRGF
jgi:hypothetical protein